MSNIKTALATINAFILDNAREHARSSEARAMLAKAEAAFAAGAPDLGREWALEALITQLGGFHPLVQDAKIYAASVRV